MREARYKNDRVGLYVTPRTRNLLNKLKADMTLATGKTMSQDDVILILIDRHAAAQPIHPTERVPEYA